METVGVVLTVTYSVVMAPVCLYYRYLENKGMFTAPCKRCTKSYNYTEKNNYVPSKG